MAVSQWVGLKHYHKLASDKFFKTAVFNSVEYMLLTLLLLIPIPMLLAVLMESRLTKAKGVWKVIMYIPALTSVVISGMLFRLMFSEGGQRTDEPVNALTWKCQHSVAEGKDHRMGSSVAALYVEMDRCQHAVFYFRIKKY